MVDFEMLQKENLVTGQCMDLCLTTQQINQERVQNKTCYNSVANEE